MQIWGIDIAIWHSDTQHNGTRSIVLIDTLKLLINTLNR